MSVIQKSKSFHLAFGRQVEGQRLIEIVHEFSEFKQR